MRRLYKIDWVWVKKELLEKERIDNMTDKIKQESLIKISEKCLMESRAIAQPKVISIARRIRHIKNDVIVIERGPVISSRKIARYLRGSDTVCLFLATIGDSVEKKASELMSKGDHLSGYIFDRIGSFAVESLAENTEKLLRKSYNKKNKSISIRFSPGYCDWPIEGQFAMDRILKFKKAGVELTKNCMMVPKKSISAFVGVGPKGAFKEGISQCNICRKDDCYYRRTS